MKILDNYLNEVGSYLPVKNRDDIVDELRDELISSAGSDKPVDELNEQDWYQVLLRFGHPAKVAANYMGDNPLISHEMTGLFWVALKPAVFIVIGLYTLIAVIDILSGRSVFQAIPAAFSNSISGIISMLGYLLMAAALLSHFDFRNTWFKNWHPKNLPNRGTDDAISRSSSIFEVLLSSIFVAWWFDWVSFSTVALSAEKGLSLKLSEAWQPYFLAIAALSIAEIFRSGWHIFYPYRSLLSSLVRVGLNLASLLIMVQLLRADSLVVLSGVPVTIGQEDDLVEGIGQLTKGVLYVIGFIQTMEIGSDLCWLWQRRR